MATVLGTLLLLQTLWVTIGTGVAPNAVSFPILDQLLLLETIWQSNPLPALSISLHQPVFLLEHRQVGSGYQVWGLYYYPLSLAGLLGIASAAATITDPAFLRQRRRLTLFISGIILAGLGLTYIRLGSCCGADPHWSLDLLLFAQAVDPTHAGHALVDWQSFYRFLEPVWRAIQVVFIATGCALMLFSTRTKSPPAMH